VNHEGVALDSDPDLNAADWPQPKHEARKSKHETNPKSEIEVSQTCPNPADRLVEFVEIYPTRCDLAGRPLPAHLQGTSFRPLLEQPARTDRYRYVEWRDRRSGGIVAQELYDHQSDPAENENIAVRAAHKELLTKLSAQLAAGGEGARPK
jgi:hypothetical protein